MNGDPTGTPDAPDLIVRNNTDIHRFEAMASDDRVVGFLVYDPVPARTLGGKGMFVAIHTVVEPEWAGVGVAPLLARTALDHARAQHLTVIAECPYVHAFIERHPEYQDLVP